MLLQTCTSMCITVRRKACHHAVRQNVLQAHTNTSCYRGAPIRAFSVSLLAVAAVAASLLLLREHDAQRPTPPVEPGTTPTAPLDAIRAAGL